MRLLEKYLTLFIAGLLLTLFAQRAWGETSAPMIVAFWGIVFVTPALMDLVPWLYRHLRRQALQPLDGLHYEFGGTRIRIVYAGRQIWLALEDLHRALGRPLDEAERQHLLREGGSLLIPGTRLPGIVEARLHDYVLALHSPEGGRFLLWFEQTVAGPLHAKLERGLPIAETVKRKLL